ncbi:RNA 2',3'-cyclic phosphodiesterase [Sphingomicrobium flavum]|uniref:RNA 2',3'-cyclic phosphodiesterase n=1 Tax=Sphingomicrobium flavum TaxID=1229164 RepID=UPI0021ADF67B|nr:RNA 2',3'-cyclic phosphodiesterase [Sphingomicrobium flavum]
MHRLFIAIPAPEALIDTLAPAMEGGPPNLRWVPEEDLHCTLRFIGNVERGMIPQIVEVLGDIRSPAIAAQIDGVGILDHRRHGALWARLQPKAALTALHHKIDRALQTVGLEPEHRAYLPHITLARWSGGRIHARAWAERNAGLASEAQPFDSFTLFESRLSRHGASYTPIADFGLA